MKPFRIATGPSGNDYHWTEVVMERAGDRIDGLDLHNYTLDGTWTKKGEAIDFDEDGWFRMMQRAMTMDELIANHKAIMDEHDPEKRVWLIVGEWGTWHEQEEGSTPGFLYQQNSLRDALIASTILDIFHQHLDRVKMANIAQTINVLQAMILTDGERMLKTPTYHVFDLYKPHRDATALAFELDRGEYVRDGNTLSAVSATVSRNDAGRIHVSLTNIDPNEARTVELTFSEMDGMSVKSARILTAEEMNAHNTFDVPDALIPVAFDGAEVSEGKLVVSLPAKSLVTIAVE